MPKKFGVTTITDKQYGLLKWYKNKLEMELCNNPVDIDTVKVMREKIKHLEQQINRRHIKKVGIQVLPNEIELLKNLQRKAYNRQQLSKKEIALLTKYAGLRLSDLPIGTGQ